MYEMWTAVVDLHVGLSESSMLYQRTIDVPSDGSSVLLRCILLNTQNKQKLQSILQLLCSASSLCGQKKMLTKNLFGIVRKNVIA